MEAAGAINACILRRSVDTVKLDHRLDGIAERLFRRCREVDSVSDLLRVSRDLIAIRAELSEERFALGNYFAQLAKHLDGRARIAREETGHIPSRRFWKALASHQEYERAVEDYDKPRTLAAAYQWIKEHGQTYGDGELPVFQSWRRYLNGARRLEEAGSFDEQPADGPSG